MSVPSGLSDGTINKTGAFRFLATKVGFNPPTIGNGLSRKLIRQEIEGSLRRLGTDHVDLYYAHKDHRADPLEETLAALRGRDPREGSDALQMVCAYLIGLLFTFLGEPLTTHLIRITWPGLTNEEADGGEREIR